MANGERGEMAISLGGVSYTLRPDHTAMYAIDDAVEGGIIAFAIEANRRGTMPVSVIALIIAEGMRAQGRATNDQALAASSTDVVRRLVFEAFREPNGATGLNALAMRYLAAALSGGVTPGNVEAAAGQA